jgi:AcrR family transcriptional regulator
MSAAVDPIRRQRNARGEGERLRTDLLEAAANLMATHGDIESISLRAVAREAGVSATAVYRHFDDHHDLLRESVEYCWTNFRQSLVDSTVGVSDPFDALQALRAAYVAFALEHPGQYRVMFSNRMQPEGDSAVIGLAAYQLLVDSVAAILEALGDDRDPYFVAAQLHTWLHGVVDLWSNHPDVSWPGADQLIDGMVHTIRLTRRTEGD